jgi:hypothetical protein
VLTTLGFVFTDNPQGVFMRVLVAIITFSVTLSTFADVKCTGEIFSINLEDKSDYHHAFVFAKGQLVDQVALQKEKVNTPEYEELKSLYLGESSRDEYGLFIFKEKDQGKHISFFQIQNKLTEYKKVIELRCQFIK